jgi:signal transduction histidine kinase
MIQSQTWKNWSIRKKILVPLLVASAFAISSLMFMEYLQIHREIQSTLKMRGIAIAHGIAYSSENVTDIGSMRRILTAISAESDVSQSLIVDSLSSEIKAANKMNLIGKKLSESNVPKAVQESLTSSVDETIHDFIMDDEKHLWFTVPVRVMFRNEDSPTEKSFGLALKLNAKPSLERAQSLFREQVVVITLLSFFIWLLCYIILQNSIIIPLQNITSAYADKSSIDDISFLPETRNDEIGRLAKVLNKLVSTVRENNEKIESNQIILANSAKFSSLGEMAGGIAHEINNPLAILKGHLAQVIVKLRAGNMSPEDAVNRLSKLESVVDRMAAIIKGLRTFARAGESDPMERVSVKNIIDETLSLGRMRLQNHNIELREDYNNDLQILARSVQISQVMLNLMNNAFDAIATLPNPWIKVSSMSYGKDVLIRVQDSGQGIPPEVLQKLMQPFFTTKPVGKGTGLGLSISKGIAEDHNGEISYELFQGHTSFVLRIPMCQES